MKASDLTALQWAQIERMRNARDPASWKVLAQAFGVGEDALRGSYSRRLAMLQDDDGPKVRIASPTMEVLDPALRTPSAERTRQQVRRLAEQGVSDEQIRRMLGLSSKLPASDPYGTDPRR